MFKQIFASETIPYRTPEEWAGVPNGEGLAALYNGYLITPPRIYGETVYGIAQFGLFVDRNEPTVNGSSTITLFSFNERIYWPGFGYMGWKWDATSGEYIERFDIGGDIYSGILFLKDLTQGFDGSIWASYNPASIEEFDPIDYSSQQVISGAFFGRTVVSTPLVDKSRDIVLMPSENFARSVSVYTLSTGALVRTIPTSGIVVQLCAEDDKRCYALTENRIVNLLDYTTGEIISAFQCPAPPTAWSVLLAWERRLRRLLVFAVVPDDTDGACLSIIRGYYPVPLATHLVKPIPLIAPRKGREIPILLRAVGDIAEPLTGVMPSLEATGDATIVRAPVGTDGRGEAIARLLCNTAGNVVLDVEAVIDDGL